MLRPLYAILIDGGYLTKKLYSRLNRHATADDIEQECRRLQAIPQVDGYELLRIYYYDAYPSAESLTTPVGRHRYNLASTERFRHSQSLYDQLEMKPHFALRMGQTNISPYGWRIKPKTARDLLKVQRPLTDDDFLPDITQKGVDMRVGMDMARLALRDMVRAIIVVTGDSDFVPAFKFVRREGVKVILEPLGNGGRRELRQHADVVLDVAPKAAPAAAPAES